MCLQEPALATVQPVDAAIPFRASVSTLQSPTVEELVASAGMASPPLVGPPISGVSPAVKGTVRAPLLLLLLLRRRGYFALFTFMFCLFCACANVELRCLVVGLPRNLSGRVGTDPWPQWEDLVAGR